jgi:hypothetical protein
MLPVIKWATGTYSKSFRKYISNISGKHEFREVQTKKTSVLDITYIHTYILQKALMLNCKTYVTSGKTLDVARIVNKWVV